MTVADRCLILKEPAWKHLARLLGGFEITEETLFEASGLNRRQFTTAVALAVKAGRFERCREGKSLRVTKESIT